MKLRNPIRLWLNCLPLLTLLMVTLACGAAATPAGIAPAPLPTMAGLETPLALPTLTLGPLATAEPSAAPAILERRLLALEWPATIPVGSSDQIRLSLEMDSGGKITPTAEVAGHEVTGKAIEIPDVYKTHNVVAEARLDLAGMEVRPQDIQSESLLPGGKVSFYWSVSPPQAGDFRGSVWLHLNFVPKEGGPQLQSLVSVQRIEIHGVTFLGLGAATARWIGAIGSILGTVLSAPFLESLLKWVWNKLRGQ